MSHTTASSTLKAMFDLTRTGQAGVTTEDLERLYEWAQEAHPQDAELFLAHELSHRYAGNDPEAGSPEFTSVGEPTVTESHLLAFMRVPRSPAAAPSPRAEWTLATAPVINHEVAKRLGL